MVGEEIVGHIMFTKGWVEGQGEQTEILVVAPLAVSPKYQSVGVGSSLMKEGLRIAKEQGYKGVSVLGSEKYYPKFGYQGAIKFGIKAPFEVPSENFMALELYEDALKDAEGTLVYAKEFFEK